MTELTWAIRELQNASQEASRALASSLGLRVTDITALQHLAVADLPIGPVQLGQLLGITSASATALVDRLERAGHLQRAPHPRDGRRLTLILSPNTAEQIFRALVPLTRAIDRAANRLSPIEARATRRFLSDTSEALRSYANAQRSAGHVGS